MKQYFVVHKTRPRDALRVCRNSRVAQCIVDCIGPDYLVSEGPIDRVVNRVVSDISLYDGSMVK